MSKQQGHRYTKKKKRTHLVCYTSIAWPLLPPCVSSRIQGAGCRVCRVQGVGCKCSVCLPKKDMGKMQGARFGNFKSDHLLNQKRPSIWQTRPIYHIIFSLNLIAKSDHRLNLIASSFGLSHRGRSYSLLPILYIFKGISDRGRPYSLLPTVYSLHPQH